MLFFLIDIEIISIVSLYVLDIRVHCIIIRIIRIIIKIIIIKLIISTDNNHIYDTTFIYNKIIHF